MTFVKNENVSKKDKAMNDVVYAQGLFKEAFPERRYGSVKEMLNAAYRTLSPKVTKDFTHRRARSIWEGAAKRIDGEEVDALRIAALEEHKREQRELRARLASLDEMLASVDQDVSGGTLASLRSQKGGLGGVYHDRKGRG